jgi:dihydroflavonol-4-reductase
MAARISLLPGDYDALYRVNVLGTRNVLRAARRAGVRRLVHASTIETLLLPNAPSPIDEGLPISPELIPGEYGRSKALSEVEVMRAAEDGLEAVIVNPTGVIGPRDFKPSFFGHFLTILARGLMPVLVPGGFDLVDVRDVARGCRAAMARGRSSQRYLLAGDYMTVEEIASAVEAAGGATRPRITVPLWLAELAAHFTPAFYRLTGLRPLFTQTALGLLSDGRRISSAKAREELGYAPTDPRSGLQEAIDWFRRAGVLAPR